MATHSTILAWRAPRTVGKDMTPEDEPPRLEGVQYATGEERRAITNSSRKYEVAGLRQKRCSLVDVSGGES